MISGSAKLRYLSLLMPLAWGLLSYTIFSVLKSFIPVSHFAAVPVWLWLWILQMLVFLPFWIWLSKQNFERKQRGALEFKKIQLFLGKPIHYLVLAYVCAFAAIPFHNTWFAKWLVFGGLVSPIFEELFSRNLLTPWLEKTWAEYGKASLISSFAFSLMHWGFNNAEALSFTPQQQLLKFFSHFVFALILCVIFKLTKSLPLLIWLHIASNLSFILTKL